MRAFFVGIFLLLSAASVCKAQPQQTQVCEEDPATTFVTSVKTLPCSYFGKRIDLRPGDRKVQRRLRKKCTRDDLTRNRPVLEVCPVSCGRLGVGSCVPTASPTAAPSGRPSGAPVLAPAPTSGGVPPECELAVECYPCVRRGCFFRLGGGQEACLDCLPLRGRCGNSSSGYCTGFRPGVIGRDGCLARMESECGNFLPED